MNFTLHQLQIYLKVVEKQSITKASNDLFLTQPAISIQLKNFQDQFEFPLIDVVGKKVCVTDFGKEIAVAAEHILQQVQAIKHKTLAYKGQLSGRLKISVVSTGKYVLPYFLSAFIKDNPGIELVMDVTNKLKVVESLENNEVDFALVSILPEKLHVEKVDRIRNKLFLVGNADKTFKNRECSKELFEELPLVFREKDRVHARQWNGFSTVTILVCKRKWSLPPTRQ